MQRRIALIAVLMVVTLVLCIGNVSGTIVSRTWNVSNPSPALSGCLDANYTAETCPVWTTINPYMGTGRINTSQTQYQTMVIVPKFYYKVDNITLAGNINWKNFSISDTPATGYKVYPWFSINGTIVPYQEIGAFDASVQFANGTYNTGDFGGVNFSAGADKLSSIAGVKPVSGNNNTGLTMSAFRTLAQNRMTGWELQSFNGVSAIELMYVIEYGNFNSQSVLSAGVTQITDDSTTNMAVNTGYTAGVGTNSTNLGNASGQAVITHYKTSQTTYPMSYHGVENFYGNIWTWDDGINIKADHNPWIADHGFASNTFAPPYVNTTLTLPAANGWISNLASASGFDWAFLPGAAAGLSTTYLSDYYYQNTGNMAALGGGAWDETLNAGAFGWSMSGAASTVFRAFGARVAYTSPVYANFTTSINGATASFTDTSFNISTVTGLQNLPESFNWSFGDNTYSTSQNPSHTYAANGTYTITENASITGGAAGAYSYATQWVTVTIPPTASFTANQTSGTAPPLAVQFTDTSTNTPTSWNWSFTNVTGNNTPVYWTLAQNPVQTFGVGNFSIMLNASNAGGSNISTQTTFINVIAPFLTGGFTGSNLTGNSPLVVHFTDSSTNATGWSYTFGDGNTSTSQNPTNIYYAIGTYTVVQTVTSPYGSNTTTKTNYITVNPVAASFTASPTSGAAPLIVTLNDTSTGAPTAWLYQFDDGGTLTTQNGTHTFTTPGSHTANLTASNVGGSNTSVNTVITVIAPPVNPVVASFTPSGPISLIYPMGQAFTDTSTGSPTYWNWNWGDGTHCYTQNCYKVWYGPGIYTVNLTVNSTLSDYSSNTTVVQVMRPWWKLF